MSDNSFACEFFAYNVLSSEKRSSKSDVPKSIKTGRQVATFPVQSTENFHVFKL